ARYLLLNEKRKLKKRYADRAISSKENKVLFITYTNHLSKEGKIDRLQNLIDSFKDDNSLKSFVLFVDPLSKNTYSRIRDKNNIYNHYDSAVDEKAKNISLELFARWNRLPEEHKQELITIGGKKAWEYFRYPLNFYFSKEFLYIIVLHYELLKKIVKEQGIKAIVLTAVNSLEERCAMAIAKNNGIPSYYIQHGIGEGVIPLELYSTKILVFGEKYRQNLIGLGCDKEKILVTGPLIFDDLLKYKKSKLKSIDEVKKILVLTQPFLELNIWDAKQKDLFMDNLSKIFMLFDGSKKTIKLHPLEEEKSYLSFFNGSSRVEIKKEADTYSLIDQADLIIGIYSTTLCAATILNKPIILLDLFNNINPQEWGGGRYINKEISLYLTDTDQALDKISNFLESFNLRQNIARRDKYIKDNFYKVDGDGYKRIYKIIKKNKTI
ncbi:MAG: hypothetical protein AABX05_04935, partial [Nanoarchaeota archaeon]